MSLRNNILIFLLLIFVPNVAPAFEPLFGARIDYDAGAGNSVVCADLDGDTHLDLAVANWGSRNVSILKNNGDGTFQSAVDYPAGEHPASVFCADLDGDTDLDLAVTNELGKNISTLFNLTSPEVYVDEEKGDITVRSFSLSQNYPNPFNPTTTIEYRVYRDYHSVNSPIPTTLTIYNILGQRVKVLADEAKFPGEYKAVWDGKDNKGNLLASGVYFYRLRSGKFSQTKKLVLLR